MTGDDKKDSLNWDIEFTDNDVRRVCPNIGAVEDPFEKVLNFDVMKYELAAAEVWWAKHLKEKHGGEVNQAGCFIWSEGLGFKIVNTSVGRLISCYCVFCEESELVTEP